MLVLDEQFHVLAASRSFHEIFKVDAEETPRRLFYSLGDGQWDIPALRLRLTKQLDATLDTASSIGGMRIVITCALFGSALREAA